jgi:uncharacterized protein YqeY
MTLETLQMDMVKCWKAKMVFEKNVLSNMIDAVKKASMTANGRVEITEQLVNETLQKYQKTVQEQYDTCPDSAEDPQRDAELKERKAAYLRELRIVKEYAPQLLTDPEEIKESILSLIGNLPLVKSNRGSIMKVAASELRGKADMSVVNKVVGDLLV